MNTNDRASSIKMNRCSFIAGPVRLDQDENGSWRNCDHDDDPTVDLERLAELSEQYPGNEVHFCGQAVYGWDDQKIAAADQWAIDQHLFIKGEPPEESAPCASSLDFQATHAAVVDESDNAPSALPLAGLCSLSGAIMGALFMLAGSALTAPSDRERITADIQMSQQARECATTGRDLRVITERGHAVRIECSDPVFTER